MSRNTIGNKLCLGGDDRPSLESIIALQTGELRDVTTFYKSASTNSGHQESPYAATVHEHTLSGEVKDNDEGQRELVVYLFNGTTVTAKLDSRKDDEPQVAALMKSAAKGMLRQMPRLRPIAATAKHAARFDVFSGSTNTICMACS